MAQDELQEIVLIDDDGQEHTFHLLEVVEVDERRYALLQPTDEPEDDDGESAYLFRIETGDDGDDHLVAVEDDEEFDRVAMALEAHDHDHYYDDDDDFDEEEDDEIDG